ncbi:MULTISPECIES: hypothetical protein [unclassified Variovorax]|uniref:hypothetical protein n=1 Tax=unclassified Variovorax TaxID=663243 RepID=UPI00131914DC|nr:MULTISPECIES: hypothetical protein [unclassified Variovorax]VTU42366.1 hypothetical protein H6P1_00168 [Variovorax sp. PBL-H6]VTU44011.1 hypothetical protein SRS16P1_00734 [Variovorax sp. SRS16]VTU44096.1 hypothetical protein E5P1_00727 [Variovorax sp. PBL-E5]
MAQFNVEFDATGFTRNATVSAGQLSDAFIQAFNARHAKARTFPKGVATLVRGQVCPERSGNRAGTRCFVTIVLAVEAPHEEAAENFYPPSAFLKLLFDVLGENQGNEASLSLERGWEITAIESLETELA